MENKKSYKDVCPNCELEKNTINDFFCIKNRGMCENCLQRRATSISQWYDGRPVDKKLAK